MFAYCLNNPQRYLDWYGFSAVPLPKIVNGLNLPAEGGIPVVIDGTVYYYAISYSPSGALYEYWFDSQGNLVHVRHHSDHNKPHKHKDPHDHQGGKDKDGNNTIISGPQDVDNNFHSPKQSFDPTHRENQTLGYFAAGSLLGFAIYSVAKWVVATIFAPPTGGGSYAVAGLMP